MAKAVKYSVEIFLQSKNMMEVSDILKDHFVDDLAGSGMGSGERDVQWIKSSKADAFLLGRALSNIAEDRKCDHYIVIRPTKNY